ncbi:GGDEF domain-containing protein [Butyrivibrio sp. CB08]|uniref:GGDEF domain-containing protein n=1 Tax=Butyrivibrio sp. CB08 TaxID=2364879 RepID=UPI001314D207|nr:GGDEF domain-containing protein [Butyrivibrio sp. CB08]
MNDVRPLRKSIVTGCVLMTVVLCLSLAIANYIGYRNTLYVRYEAYITDLLRFAADNIDVDDMEECLETGVKSEKFEETQALFDNIKDTHNIDFIYVIIPLNTKPTDNIMNVIAGMSTYEKKYIPENAVTLGGLTGTDYTAKTAKQYYDAVDSGDKIFFFEEWADRWGRDYTGIMSLYDSEGNYFAELCVDVSVNDINNVIRYHVMICVLLIVIISLLFTFIFLSWTKRNITDPIQSIEHEVVALAQKSRGQGNPDELVINMPRIQAKNELRSLSTAITTLSEDLRNYLVNALSARDVALAAQRKARELSEQANKDSLTGIRNRQSYDTEVSKIEWNIESKGFTRFGIGMVDMNFLKRINDTYGHEKGNLAIIKLCTVVCKTFAHSPVFRIGGDEFAIVLENEDYEDAEARVEEFKNILKKLEEDESLEPWDRVSAAIGWSLFDPATDKKVEDVFKRADSNMYENKKAMKAMREA